MLAGPAGSCGAAAGPASLARVAGPDVSVLVPVFDGAAYVGAALRSVLAQEGVAFEVVVCDDGSTDDSVAVVESFADPRVVVVRQANAGIAAALNAAAARARGRYLARLDADDLCRPGRLRAQAAVLDADAACVLVASDFEVVDAAGIVTGRRAVPVSDLALRARLLVQSPVAHGSVLLRRAAFERAGGYRSAAEPAEDYDLWVRLAALGTFASVPEPLYAHRAHAGQVSARRAAAQAARARESAALARRTLAPPALTRRLLAADRARHTALSPAHAEVWRAAVREAALAWLRDGHRRTGLAAAAATRLDARYAARVAKALAYGFASGSRSDDSRVA